jgi:hypothetical protein
MSDRSTHISCASQIVKTAAQRTIHTVTTETCAPTSWHPSKLFVSVIMWVAMCIDFACFAPFCRRTSLSSALRSMGSEDEKWKRTPSKSTTIAQKSPSRSRRVARSLKLQAPDRHFADGPGAGRMSYVNFGRSSRTQACMTSCSSADDRR